MALNGFSKCHKYSPSERNKAFEKTVVRKPGMAFNPEKFTEYLEDPRKDYSREELVQHYCDVSMCLFFTASFLVNCSLLLLEKGSLRLRYLTCLSCACCVCTFFILLVFTEQV